MSSTLVQKRLGCMILVVVGWRLLQYRRLRVRRCALYIVVLAAVSYHAIDPCRVPSYICSCTRGCAAVCTLGSMQPVHCRRAGPPFVGCAQRQQALALHLTISGHLYQHLQATGRRNATAKCVPLSVSGAGLISDVEEDGGRGLWEGGRGRGGAAAGGGDLQGTGQA